MDGQSPTVEVIRLVAEQIEKLTIVPPFCVVFGVDFGAFVPLYAR